MTTGVILYGPPGAGMNTVTAALCMQGTQYAHFRRLKVTIHPEAEYRCTTVGRLNALEGAGLLLYRTSRHGAEYAIDSPELTALCSSGRIPVVRVGQVAGLFALDAYPLHWVRVLLWCPREIIAARFLRQGDSDVPGRLEAWAQTREDLVRSPAAIWTLALGTDHTSPSQAAARIHAAVEAHSQPTVATGEALSSLGVLPR